jgi:hypothetical protein
MRLVGSTALSWHFCVAEIQHAIEDVKFIIIKDLIIDEVSRHVGNQGGRQPAGRALYREPYSTGLFKSARYTAEGRVQVGSESLYGNDDRHRDARCD